MMIYSFENEICSFSNGWYAISYEIDDIQGLALIYLQKYDTIIINKKIAEGEANETNNIYFINLDFFICIIELQF